MLKPKKRALRATTHATHYFQKNHALARDPPARPTHATCPFSKIRALRATYPRTTMLKPKKRALRATTHATHHVQKKSRACARPTCATRPHDVPIFENSRAARDLPADHHAQTKKIAGCERPTRVPSCSNQKSRTLLRAAHPQTTMRDPPANRHVQSKKDRAPRATYPRTTMFKPTKIARCARPTMRAMSATMVTIHES